MISNIIWYFIIGVVFNFLYDKAVDYTEAEYRFTMSERFVVTLFWPIMLIIFVYHLIKTMLSGES